MELRVKKLDKWHQDYDDELFRSFDEIKAVRYADEGGFKPKPSEGSKPTAVIPIQPKPNPLNTLSSVMKDYYTPAFPRYDFDNRHDQYIIQKRYYEEVLWRQREQLKEQRQAIQAMTSTHISAVYGQRETLKALDLHRGISALAPPEQESPYDY